MSEAVPPEAASETPARLEHMPGDLTEGPVTRTLLMFALPTLGSNVLQSLNGSISAVYVGKFLGENAFAATGIATMVMFLIFSGTFGLSMAATIMIGQAMGRRDFDEVRRVNGATTGAFIVISLAIALLGGLLAPPLLHLLSTPAEAFDYAVEFLHVVFIGIPLVFVSMLLQSALRGVGDAVTPLWTTVLNLVFSVLLNPLFILGWGPIPAMGLAGAAWAGVVTNGLCLIFLVLRTYMLDSPLCLRGSQWRLLRPDWGRLKPVLAMGVPMSLSMVIMSISSVIMMGLINREGVDTVAGYNAANQLWNYIQMPAFAVSSAVSAMAAQNIGAGRWDRISAIARTGLLVNLAMTGLLVLASLPTDHFLLSLFLPATSPALDIGEHINLMIGWTFIPMTVSMVLTSIVRANGAVVAPFVILFVSVILVRLTLGFGLYDWLGAEAIWFAFMASSSSSALMAAAYYLKGGWRKPRAMAGRRAALG
ncbi:MATE family efflux transporter [Novosphingobium sp. TH158]|uniref:MATE family efflux transporter n=1 Tax=Novosphingobium sp. TH158 TaxID=2067455 RepID=UPI000C7B81BA|nr:MATE family efflux transporter [Novosphingobium sp. TH158]PLK26497.1 MATE family efflux transporter [Novosphingobium sp. TH158]